MQHRSRLNIEANGLLVIGPLLALAQDTARRGKAPIVQPDNAEELEKSFVARVAGNIRTTPLAPNDKPICFKGHERLAHCPLTDLILGRELGLARQHLA